MSIHLEKAIEEIDAKIADLKRSKAELVKVAGTLAGGVKRTLSKKARKAISEAQKARWAVRKATKATVKKVKALV